MLSRLKRMDSGKLLITGIAGSAVMTVFCFTPALVAILGVLGLSAAVGWLDYVLFPALGAFIAITGYALWRRLALR